MGKYVIEKCLKCEFFDENNLFQTCQTVLIEGSKCDTFKKRKKIGLLNEVIESHTYFVCEVCGSPRIRTLFFRERIDIDKYVNSKHDICDRCQTQDPHLVKKWKFVLTSLIKKIIRW